jgi:hypothetical protein
LTAHEETSAKRIAAIFRRLGISHLGVSDANNKLVGVITRRHLIKPPAALPSTPHLAPQRGVEELLAADDLQASPEAVMELQRYDAALQLETSAMEPLEDNQRAAAAASHRRGASLLGAEDAPAVRFDDEEDTLSPELVAASASPEPESSPEPEEHVSEEKVDEELGRSTGGGVSMLNRSAGSTGGSNINNSTGSSGYARGLREATANIVPGAGGPGITPRGRPPRLDRRSSLFRLQSYTKQLQ